MLLFVVLFVSITSVLFLVSVAWFCWQCVATALPLAKKLRKRTLVTLRHGVRFLGAGLREAPTADVLESGFLVWSLVGRSLLAARVTRGLIVVVDANRLL